ncbi:hypothetical protein P8X24_09230 [Pyrococcus kukulkanii]
MYLVRDNMLVPLRLLFKPENRSGILELEPLREIKLLEFKFDEMVG